MCIRDRYQGEAVPYEGERVPYEGASGEGNPSFSVKAAHARKTIERVCAATVNELRECASVGWLCECEHRAGEFRGGRARCARATFLQQTPRTCGKNRVHKRAVE
eukprot:1111756-Prymnesium_polylepis.1